MSNKNNSSSSTDVEKPVNSSIYHFASWSAAENAALNSKMAILVTEADYERMIKVDSLIYCPKPKDYRILDVLAASWNGGCVYTPNYVMLGDIKQRYFLYQNIDFEHCSIAWYHDQDTLIQHAKALSKKHENYFGLVVDLEAMRPFSSSKTHRAAGRFFTAISASPDFS